MSYKRNENDQLIETTPDGQSDKKLVLYGFDSGTFDRFKMNSGDRVRLHLSECEINSATGEEVGTPTKAARLECSAAEFWGAIAEGLASGKGPDEVLAALVCDLYGAKLAPVEGEV